MYLLDLFELQWTELRLGLVHGSPPSARIYAGIAGDARLGGKIFVFGGVVGIEGCERMAPKGNIFSNHNLFIMANLGISNICFLACLSFTMIIALGIRSKSIIFI
jgi:hypothetical protein